MQILYIVGTPIGNLEDITLRALRVLGEVDAIVCEDTRVTQKLLKHYKINPSTSLGTSKLKSFHEHSRLPNLDNYNTVAYVSDAGTPGLSDPGAGLVKFARESGVKIEAVPGPSALTTLISLLGHELPEFTFLGFLPHKKGRHTLLQEIANSSRPVILFESTHRITRLMQELPEDCHVTIGRELTKKFEEVLEGTPAGILAIFSKHPEKQKGEFVVFVTHPV